MTFGELVGRVVIYGGLAVGGYYVYHMVYAEPVTRASVNRDPANFPETDEDSAPNLDDCERYINSDTVQDCIRARTNKSKTKGTNQ